MHLSLMGLCEMNGLSTTAALEAREVAGKGSGAVNGTLAARKSLCGPKQDKWERVKGSNVLRKGWY